MKKSFFVVGLLAIAMLLTTAAAAMAGGWTTVDYSQTHDPNDTVFPNGQAIWNPNQASPRSPHGYFSSSSNKCRVCHAVHEANSNSWRLLGASSSVAECDVCHGQTGITQKRPYATTTWTIRGEHTLGSTVIPDSTVTTTLSAGLICNSCHSVHGANTTISYGASDTAGWDPKILKRNPNGDAQTLAIGAAGAASSTTVDTNIAAKRSNFCADCHNKNPNWNTSDPVDASAGMRANPTSHVQGPSAEGTLSVNSTNTQVANYLGSQNTQGGCMAYNGSTSGCHNASDLGNNPVTNPSDSRFPHRSIGAKLISDNSSTADNPNDPATNLNNSSRVIPNMDAICLSCHNDPFNGGVGETF